MTTRADSLHIANVHLRPGAGPDREHPSATEQILDQLVMHRRFVRLEVEGVGRVRDRQERELA